MQDATVEQLREQLDEAMGDNRCDATSSRGALGDVGKPQENHRKTIGK